MSATFTQTSGWSDEEVLERLERVSLAVEHGRLAARYSSEDPDDVIAAASHPAPVASVDPDWYPAGTRFYYGETLVLAVTPEDEQHVAVRA